MFDKLKSLLHGDDHTGEFVTTQQAAAILKVTPRWVRRLIASGTLRGSGVRHDVIGRTFGRWTIPAVDVWAYDESRGSRADRLRRWRQSWARAQHEKRRRTGGMSARLNSPYRSS